MSETAFMCVSVAPACWAFWIPAITSADFARLAATLLVFGIFMVQVVRGLVPEDALRTYEQRFIDVRASTGPAWCGRRPCLLTLGFLLCAAL